MSSFSETVTSPTQPPLALILAGLVAQGVGVCALAFPLTNTGYTAFVLFLSVLGAFFSLGARRRPNADRMLLPGGIGLILFFGLTQVFITRFGRVLPWEFLIATGDLSIILALTLTASLSTFLWVTDVAVLFACVWSIAMIGLSATLNINVLTIIGFAIYLACALFLMIHQHALAQSGQQGRARVMQGQLLWFQLRTAAVLFLATFVLGMLVAVPLQMLGRNMSLATLLERFQVKPKPGATNIGKSKLVFDSPKEFVVGLGPVTDDDTLLYHVTSPKPSYWRLRTFAVCTGNEWTPFGTDIEDGRVLSPVRTRGNKNSFTITPALEGGRKKTERIHATVEPVAGFRYLIHLVEPRMIQIDQPEISRRIDGTLGLPGSRLDIAPPPTTYELDADLSTATSEDLNKTSARYPAEVRERYLGEPDPGKLDELARTAVGDAKGPYDRAEAIRKFVANRCTYSLDAPACPPGRNPAEWFLNDSKVGYCDLYATAVTLLCRAAGIPARIVTGFNAGEIDPDHPNAYNLRERNRHAWCEVFFVDYGWMRFDATEQTTEATEPPIASAPMPKAQSRKLPLGPLALVGAALVGLLGVGAYELLRRRGFMPQRKVISSDERALQQLLQVYSKALKALARNGTPRLRSQTIHEHLELVQINLGEQVHQHYEPLARLSERMLFARHQPTTSELTAAERALSALKTALKERKS